MIARVWGENTSNNKKQGINIFYRQKINDIIAKEETITTRVPSSLPLLLSGGLVLLGADV